MWGFCGIFRNSCLGIYELGTECTQKQLENTNVDLNIMILSSLIYFSVSEPKGEVSGTTFIITGSGEISQSFYRGKGNYQLYTEIDIREKISIIGSLAFIESSNLKTLKINSYLEIFNSDSLRFCPNLNEIIVDKENSNFKTDSQGLLLSSNETVLWFCPAQIVTFKIPTTVKHIAEQCFHNTRATSIHIPWSVIYLSGGIIQDSSVTKLTFDDNITIKTLYPAISYSPVNQIVVPASVEILNQSFIYAGSLTEITFASNSKLTYITTYSFSNCPVLSLTLPEGLKTLESKALAEMKRITSIRVPSTLVDMPSDTFQSTTTVELIECNNNQYYEVSNQVLYNKNRTIIFLCSTKVTKIEIGTNMKNISTTLFQGCKLLKEIIVDPNHEQYYSEAGVLYTKDKIIALSVCGGLESVTFVRECKELNKGCCQGCQNLQSVTLTKGIETLHEHSFASSGLRSISIPSSVTTISNNVFDSASSLSDITFEEGSQLKTFGSYTFKGTNIKSIIIPKLVESIPWRLFYSQYRINNLQFEDDSNLKYINSESFLYCDIEHITFPRKLQIISGNAFLGNKKLSSIDFLEDSDLIEIQTNAFSNCNLTSLTLPSKLQKLYVSSFSDSPFLESVEFKGCLITEIEPSVFSNDIRLKKIVLPSSLITVNPFTFSNCPIYDVSFNVPSEANLLIINGIIYSKEKEILIYCPGGNKVAEVEENVKTINENAFYYAICLEKIKFPEPSEITEIPSQCFFKCTSLQEVIIPTSIRHLQKSSLEGCEKLEKIFFNKGSNLHSIGDLSFKECFSLQTIQIPNNTMILGNNIFKDCMLLKNITFEKGNKMTEINKELINNCEKLELFEFPESIQKISKDIFIKCPSLKVINFTGNQLKEITTEAFKDLPIETFLFREDTILEIIGNSAFSGTSIKSIMLPVSKTTSLGDSIFENCRNLQTFSICPMAAKFSSADNNQNFENEFIVGNKMFKGCEQLELDFENMNITKVYSEGFKGCKKLKFQRLPIALKTIEKSGFEEAGIGSVLQVHNKVERIEENSFLKSDIEKVIYCGSKDIGIEDKISFSSNVIAYVSNIFAIKLFVELRLIRFLIEIVHFQLICLVQNLDQVQKLIDL